MMTCSSLTTDHAARNRSAPAVRRRRAVTLLELVVVIGILAVLMSIAIPKMRYGVRDRKLREASRELASIIRRAKARAIEIGRPAGIWIERRDDTAAGARQGVRVHLCEVPPPFSGNTDLARVYLDTATGLLRFEGEPWPINATTLSLDRRTILTRVPGGATFKMRFEDRRPFFRVMRLIDDPSTATVDESLFLRVVTTGTVPGFVQRLSTRGMSFTAVFPPRRVGGESIEFPGDTVIDLWSSGMGALLNHFNPPAFPTAPNINDPRPVMILFSPEGDVESVMFSRLVQNPTPPPPLMVELAVIPPPGPIHLLVGRIEGVVDGVAGIPGFGNVSGNLLDPSTIWITINQRTGKITTAENVDTSNDTTLTLQQRILAARDIARSGIRMGGK